MSALQWIESQTWIDALGWTLVHSVWEGIVVAIALAIVLRDAIHERERAICGCIVRVAGFAGGRIDHGSSV